MLGEVLIITFVIVAQYDNGLLLSALQRLLFGLLLTRHFANFVVCQRLLHRSGFFLLQRIAPDAFIFRRFVSRPRGFLGCHWDKCRVKVFSIYVWIRIRFVSTDDVLYATRESGLALY